MVAVSCELLNVDVIGQGEDCYLRKSQKKNIGFSRKMSGKIYAFWLKVREIFA